MSNRARRPEAPRGAQGRVSRSPEGTYPFHHESSGVVRTSAPRLFAHLDEHARLSSHMSKSSWMMAGGRMDIQTDDGRGQRLGSRISIAGSVLGIRVAVDEIVVERSPPSTKIWQTIGAPRLLVIGHYRMGFEITRVEDSSRLQVFIDYALPETVPWRWVGSVLARYYARWCTKQMVDDAIASF